MDPQGREPIENISFSLGMQRDQPLELIASMNAVEMLLQTQYCETLDRQVRFRFTRVFKTSSEQ